jgi:hypothetical protein
MAIYGQTQIDVSTSRFVSDPVDNTHHEKIDADRFEEQKTVIIPDLPNK